MNPSRALLIPVTFALALLAPPPAKAANVPKPGASSGGHWGGSHRGGGYRGGGHRGGGWSHGGSHGYRGHSHWRPWWGFYAAAPFVYGAYYSTWDPYWGYWGPRYGGPAYYPRAYPRYYEEEYVVRRGEEDLGPGAEVDPRAPGAPSQGPLYMNYCPAAKAYYPKVTTCPEGWEFRRPSYRD